MIFLGSKPQKDQSICSRSYDSSVAKLGVRLQSLCLQKLLCGSERSLVAVNTKYSQHSFFFFMLEHCLSMESSYILVFVINDGMTEPGFRI
jgi:hypothetical protein